MNVPVRTDTTGRLVEMGVVGKPHGVRGLVRLFLHNPDATNLVSQPEIYLKRGDVLRQTALVDVKPGPKCLIAQLEGVDSREDAESWKGAAVLIPREALPSTDSGEFYVADLIDVKAMHGETCIGRIVSSRPQGDIEVVCVVGEHETVEIPLVDDFVEALDIACGYVVFKDIEELPRTPTSRIVKSSKNDI